MSQNFTDPTPSSPMQLLSANTLRTTPQIVWGPVRSLLQEKFSFGDIKSIVGTAGLDVTKIAHLNQEPGGATKGQLMTGIDRAYGELAPKPKNQFITLVVEEMLRRRQEITEIIDERLSRFGWSVINGRPVPIELLNKSELPAVPRESHADLLKAANRFVEDDLSGAISAACGAVDSVTRKIYQEKGLGDPGPAAFQEKVTRSFDASGNLAAIESELLSIGWEAAKAKQLVQNVRGSLNQAANVMQTLRSSMGDVHGTKSALRALVFDSFQWAKLILGLLQNR